MQLKHWGPTRHRGHSIPNRLKDGTIEPFASWQDCCYRDWQCCSDSAHSLRCTVEDQRKESHFRLKPEADRIELAADEKVSQEKLSDGTHEIDGDQYLGIVLMASRCLDMRSMAKIIAGKSWKVWSTEMKWTGVKTTSTSCLLAKRRQQKCHIS